MLRPQACRWFELICARDDVAGVLAALAEAGSVELQTHDRAPAPLVVPGVAGVLQRVRELARVSRGHWPAPASANGAPPLADPMATLEARLAALEAWQTEAEPLIQEAEALQARLADADGQRALLACDAALLPAPGLLGVRGGLAAEARVVRLAAPPPASEWPAGVIVHAIADPTPSGAGARPHFLVIVGHPDRLAALEPQLAALRAQRLPWPADLPDDAAGARLAVDERRAALARRRTEVDDALRALASRHRLAEVLADIALAEWLSTHGGLLAASDRLAWISGWTPTADADTLLAPLQRQGLRGVAQFGDPPAGAEPPSLLVNPPWVRAFEGFARMLGQPGRDEADPSLVLAFVAPLLFGFMFGDVGQGAVLLVAGLLLRRRWPALVLLVPGGAMAMVFGLLFGSVFAREDLIPALWLHPLHEPVTLLLAAIGLGALILLGGLALNALQAAWRGALRDWWARDAGLLLAYLGALAAPWHPAALWAVAAGAAWTAIGHAWRAGAPVADLAGATRAAGGRARAAALAAGLAGFVEHALQLAVNTVSFARVGAFALAHAGLSVAVVGVAEAAGGAAYWLLLLLGNALILVLEGLVVGIQTTRLLLFEFFLRFLQGRGRPFRPLPPPHALPAS